MGLLTGKTAIVTGAARGIGKAIALKFAAEGANVAFTDLVIDENAENTAKEIEAMGVKAKAYASNAANFEDTAKVVEAIHQDFGRIDILVNNVGISPFKPLTELSIEEFDRVIATNLRPVFITSRQLVLHRQQNGNRSYGRIINLCSTRYLQSEAGTEAYSASKGGIYSLTHSLAVSLAPFHITVNAIAPGWIHVREEEQLRPEDHAFHPSGRVGTPEDIARACLFLCDEANDFLNGQTLTIDGGATIRMIYPE